MQIDEQEITGFICEIWSTMLDLSVSPNEKPGTLVESNDSVVGSISITGAWEGVVTFDCDPKLGCQIAAIMFGEPAESISSTQIEDAVGEMTNMISGNIKSILPETCYISIPRTEHRNHRTAVLDQTQVLGSFGFLCMDRGFRVTLRSA